MAENLDFYLNQIVLARTEIKNLRQKLSALKYEHNIEIKSIKSTLNGLRCANCAETATTIIHPREVNVPTTSDCTGIITFKPIGYIETSFENKRGVPRQPSVLSKARGVVVIDSNVFNNPEHALIGLEEFSHLWIIFYFHATESTNVPAKVTPPRLGGERRGVFSTRSPHRPCPIGLSLVKISSIEGNRIHFEGVDMVNGTPVLDIKPYIPPYDCPTPLPDLASARPPTEGISDMVECLGTLRVDDEFGARSPIVFGAVSPAHSLYDEISPIEDHQRLTPTPSTDSHSSADITDGVYQDAPLSRRPEAERGAPDGQERFTPPHSGLAQFAARQDGVRVAPWISSPPTQTYSVRFTEDALQRLHELIGGRAGAFRANIEGLLREDPRSLYVRNRYPDHEYSCVLEDLSLSCVFDAQSATCTIIAVRSADELQQT